MSGPKQAPAWERVVTLDDHDALKCELAKELASRLIRLAEALKRVKEWNAEMHRVNDPSLVPCFTSDLYNDWRELMIEVRAALREAGAS